MKTTVSRPLPGPVDFGAWIWTSSRWPTNTVASDLVDRVVERTQIFLLELQNVIEGLQSDTKVHDVCDLAKVGYSIFLHLPFKWGQAFNSSGHNSNYAVRSRTPWVWIRMSDRHYLHLFLLAENCCRWKWKNGGRAQEGKTFDPSSLSSRSTRCVLQKSWWNKSYIILHYHAGQCTSVGKDHLNINFIHLANSNHKARVKRRMIVDDSLRARFSPHFPLTFNYHTLSYIRLLKREKLSSPIMKMLNMFKVKL